MILNKIINNIYIGNYRKYNNFFINENNIKVIINCTKHIPFFYNNKIINIRLSINENSNYELYYYLNYITNIIHNHLKLNNKILIFCRKGTQCSPIILAAYLIKYYKIPFNDAILKLKNKNDKILYPNIKYYNSLYKFYNNI